MEQLKFFKGKEEDLLKKTDIEAGAIYHCTDTKNTYLGTSQNGLIPYSSAIGKATNKIGGEIFNDYVNNIAGEGAHAEGESTRAEGKFSHAEGGGCWAYGEYTHAEGCNDGDQPTTASCKGAHAEGMGTISSGNGSHSEGNGSQALREASHSEGRYTKVEGDCGHAEGEQCTVADGALCGHAEGFMCRANGKYTHAEGQESIANGNASHVEGYGNVTGEDAACAHAEGDENSATGYASHVEGKKNLASSEYQHVQGKYNVEDTENKYAHIVGGGTEGARKNIHTIDWDGNAWFAGNVYIGGASQNDTNVQPIVAAADLKPILLDDQMATTYLTDFTYGDKALDAILKGRQILITTPSVGGIYTKSFSPVYMYQLPNKENEFLYLFYLTDEKESLDLSALGLGIIYLPKYA